jgi:hypothetical protein
MRLDYRLAAGSVTRSEIDLYADQRELERLRRTVVRELATHPGQEALAREIGVSRIVLRRFVEHSVPQPKHLQKIREWAEDRPPVWTPIGAVLLATVVRDLPGPERVQTRRELARVLADGFRRAGAALPGWLEDEVALERMCPQPSSTS